MNIVCIGGGPAGLYFGLLMKLRQPAHEVAVVERNRQRHTLGGGVVATALNRPEGDWPLPWPSGRDRLHRILARRNAATPA